MDRSDASIFDSGNFISFKFRNEILGRGYKDDEPSLGSQLISIGVKVTDDFELILNRKFYRFSGQQGNVVFYLTVNTLGIGYLF